MINSKLNGENALIYGATGGLGRAIAFDLIKAGLNVFLIGRSNHKLKDLANNLNLNPMNLFCTKTITNEKGLREVQTWLASLGLTFKVGIHAAGQGNMKSAAKMTLSEWNTVVDINLTSAFTFYKLFSEIHTSDSYELVYFSSAALNQIWPNNSLYGASKAGLEAFCQSLQREIKPEGGRIWLYRAGSIRTNFFATIKNHLPLEKMLTPEFISQLVVANLKTPAGVYFPLIPVLSD